MNNYYSRSFYPPYRFMPIFRQKRNYYYQEHIPSNKLNENRSQNKEAFSKKEDIKNSRNNDEKKEPIFDFFGVQLYFDDILLISLIFFLYNEGVQDQFLFISLILLLLS